ncbi:DUF222 domain-containing protein [Glutamicibacter sp. NPDC055491]
MAIPDFIHDDDDEHRLPLPPAGTRTESHKDSLFSDHLEHHLFHGPLKQLADELYDAGPLNGPDDALERLKKIQRIQSTLDAMTSVLLADSVEQVSESFADMIATAGTTTEEEEREARKSAQYYGVDRGSDQVINSNFIAEAAVALRETPRIVGKRMFYAKGLRYACKETLTALAAGEITPKAAHDIVKYSQDLLPEQIMQMQRVLLPMAKTASDDAIYQRARRFHDRMCPEAAEQRHKKSEKNRKLTLWDNENGMSTLKYYNSAAVIHSIKNSVKWLADQHNDPQDPRTREQIEADAFADIILNGWPDREGTPLKPRVSITIPAVEMLADPTRTVADLEGYGPIPLGVALVLAKDAPSFQRVLTDPWTGAAIDVERRRYRPSQSLKDLLRHRDEHCCFPGCRRPADRSEIDHINGWAHGGHTTRDNTHLLCKQHQMFKHALGWKVVPRPDGSKMWVTPHGLSALVIPESVKRVDQFDHVNDHCPERPKVIPLPHIRLTAEVRRVLGLKPRVDIPDEDPGPESPPDDGQKETG